MNLPLIEDAACIYASSGFRSFQGRDQWDCRVTFHDKHYLRCRNGNKDAFFYAARGQQTPQMLIKVLKKIENILKLKKEQHLIFGLLSTDSKVLYMETGKWWADPIRFNLLTAFLKDTHVDANIDTVIESGQTYLNPTKAAIKHFLDGNVYYHGMIFEGWVSDFANPTKFTLDKLKNIPSREDTTKVKHYYGWTEHTVELGKD